MSMSASVRTARAVLAAAVWIATSEFVRNQFLLQEHWVGHYTALGLTFPAEPVNGAVWGLWSLFLAAAILVIARRFTFRETAALAWLMGFVLMWLVIGNLGVLPVGILPLAIPLSVVEVFVATWIIHKLR
jgi:hypothetical protein